MAFRRIAQFTLLFALLFATTFGYSQAQYSTVGIPAFSSFSGEVNEGNLDVHTSIPLVKKNGLIPFESRFVFDSNMWTQAPDPSSSNLPRWIPQQAVGEANPFAYVVSVTKEPNTIGQGMTVSSQVANGLCYNFTDFFHDINGTQHWFPTFKAGASTAGCPSSGTIVSKDGQYTFVWSTGSGSFPQGKAYDMSGIAYNGSVTNPNGASITPVYGSNSFSITDSLGTTVETEYVSWDGNSNHSSKLTSVAYTGGNGAAQYTINWSTSTTALATNFSNCSNILNYANSAYFPSGITLPDGSSYTFTWEPSNSGWPANYSTGRLASITLPTGGKITYTYGAVDCTDGTPSSVTKKVFADGVHLSEQYTYSRTGTPASSVTTITALNNDTTQVSFKYYQEVLRKVWTGNNTGVTPLLQVIHCFDYSNTSGCSTATGPSSQAQAALTPQSLSVLTSYNGGSNATTTTQYGQTNAGATLPLPTAVLTYDYNGTLLRKLLTPYGTYNSSNGTCTAIGAYIFDHLCYKNIANGSSWAESTWFTYDTTAGNQGNLLTVNRNTGSQVLQTTYTYYANGAVNTVKDANGAKTTYSNMTCNGAFPQNTSSDQVTWGTSAQYDCAGAVMTSFTDANGNVTSYGHADPFWRTTSVTSPWQGTSTTTQTIGYYNTNATYVQQYVNGTTSVHTKWSVVDGLGRLQHTQTQDLSNNYDTVSYTYDNKGRLASVSNPCLSAANVECTTNLTTYTGYDGLNRVGTVTDAAGGSVIYTYSWDSTNTAPTTLVQLAPAIEGSWDAAKSYRYDALGRLTETCELSNILGNSTCYNGPSYSTSGFSTSYGYDPAGRLLSINENGQTRSFQYDWTGRLLQEQHPESGTISYAYDSPTSSCPYSSPGDLVQRTDNAGTINCFTYDGLHRPYDQSGGRHFRYDSTAPPTGVSVSNTNGRLVEAFTDGTGDATDEWFNYATNGQVTDLYQKTPNSGGYMHTTASYYEDGQLNTLSGVSGLTNSWTFGLDSVARPNQVTDPNTVVSGITYNPDGTVHTATYSNGTDTYGYDAAGRMNAFSYAIGSNTYSGSLTWNANGTLGTMQITDSAHPAADNQTCNYTYDDLVRLVKDDCGTYGSQTYSYDAFGNISKTANGLGTSFTALYANSPQNNRVTNMSFVYDANGNVKNDGNGNTYSYDPNWQTITSANGVAVTYDAFGQAVEIGTSPVLYSPVGKLGVLTTGGSYGTGAEVRIPTRAGALQYDKGASNARANHFDWLGSNRMSTVPATSTVSGGVSYTPFGEANWSAGTNIRVNFTGQDNDMGPASTYDFPARKYSAVQGRWLVPDTVLGKLSDPQTFNKYAYVRNNPLALIDPDGHDGTDPYNCQGTSCVDFSLLQVQTSDLSSEWIVSPETPVSDPNGNGLADVTSTSDLFTLTASTTEYIPPDANVSDGLTALKAGLNYITEPAQYIVADIVMGGIGDIIADGLVAGESNFLKKFTSQWVAKRTDPFWSTMTPDEIAARAESVSKGVPVPENPIVGGRNAGLGGEVNPAQMQQLINGGTPRVIDFFINESPTIQSIQPITPSK